MHDSTARRKDLTMPLPSSARTVRRHHHWHQPGYLGGDSEKTNQYGYCKTPYVCTWARYISLPAASGTRSRIVTWAFRPCGPSSPPPPRPPKPSWGFGRAACLFHVRSNRMYVVSQYQHPSASSTSINISASTSTSARATTGQARVGVAWRRAQTGYDTIR